MSDHNRHSHGHGTRLRHLLGLPFILLPFFPTVLLHICVEIYHQVAFRLYGLPLYNIKNYVRFDRERLKWLTGLQWWFCAYCTYMNGVYAYITDIAGKTEWYWCGMQHKGGDHFRKQEHQEKGFAPFGNQKDFERKEIERTGGARV